MAPAAQVQFGCAATDVRSESIDLRVAPDVKANVVRSIPKEQASSFERRNAFAGGRRGDWLEVHAADLEGWVSAADVVCHVPPAQARETIAEQAEEAVTDRNDKRHRFGGAAHSSVTGTPVQELQEDLANIGYSVGRPDGDFGAKTSRAGMMFQEHFFAGGRGAKNPDGRVDFDTAALIKSVAAGAAP